MDNFVDQRTVSPSPTDVLKKWIGPYLIGTALSGVIGAPLVWFGLDLPVSERGVWQAIMVGSVISYAIMIALDFFFTTTYLLSSAKSHSGTSHFLDRIKKFPLFSAARSLTIHWLGFSIPLIITWTFFFQRLQLPVTATQVTFFLVVSLLMSYVHAIIEYHLLGRVMEPMLILSEPTSHSWLPLFVKIAGIALFVGIVPVALLAETLFLKLGTNSQTLLNTTTNNQFQHIILWTGTYAIVSIVVSVLLTWLLASDIARASKRLTDGFRMLSEGVSSHRVQISTADEFEELASGFNTMAAEIERNLSIYEEFGKLVDPTIRDEVLAGRVKREGELRYGVVLFCDLANFTTLSERVEPTELIAYLNDLFDQLVKTISDHGGTVNKFVGDAILAFWNLPLSMQNPEIAAVSCALKMQDAVDKFNTDRTQWRQSFSPALLPTQIGVGIHGGNLVAGTVGAEHRREYTVLGAHVNLAARLQQQTRTDNCNIIVSAAIVKKIQNSDLSSRISVLPLGATALKGFAEAQSIFGIIPARRI